MGGCGPESSAQNGDKGLTLVNRAMPSGVHEVRRTPWLATELLNVL
jgi:hypothetical protein